MIRRVVFGVLVALALAALVVGGLFAYSGLTSSTGPATVVRDYYAALQRGDAAGALAYGNLPAGTHDLLTAAALRQQNQVAAISDFSIVSQTHSHRSATVAVRYVLDFVAGPQLVTDQVRLRESDGVWRLAASAVPVHVQFNRAVQRISLAGAPVPATSTLLFPGALPVRFDTSYLQLASGSVSFTGARTVAARVQVSPAGEAAVTAAVQTALTRCVDAGGVGRCPLPSERYVPGSLRGKLSGSVSAAMSVTLGPGEAGQLRVAGTVPFTGSYSTLDFDNVATAHKGTVQLPLSAIAYPTDPLVLTWTQPS